MRKKTNLTHRYSAMYSRNGFWSPSDISYAHDQWWEHCVWDAMAGSLDRYVFSSKKVSR